MVSKSRQMHGKHQPTGGAHAQENSQQAGALDQAATVPPSQRVRNSTTTRQLGGTKQTSSAGAVVSSEDILWAVVVGGCRRRWCLVTTMIPEWVVLSTKSLFDEDEGVEKEKYKQGMCGGVC